MSTQLRLAARTMSNAATPHGQAATAVNMTRVRSLVIFNLLALVMNVSPSIARGDFPAFDVQTISFGSTYATAIDVHTWPQSLNAHGQVVATTYEGSVAGAWLYDGRTEEVRRIGLQDSGDSVTSYILGFTDSGFVLGVDSAQGDPNRVDVWLYDSTSNRTTELGVWDDIIPQGVDRSSVYVVLGLEPLNESGRVVGATGGRGGLVSWSYDAIEGAHQRIGLRSAEFEGPHGTGTSIVEGINAAGVSLGSSAQWEGVAAAGHAVWIDGPSGARRIGLVDDDHTDAEGYRYSEARLLNDASFVGGVSWQFQGIEHVGESAWIYDTAEDSIRAIGLAAGEHLDGNGASHNQPYGLSNTGMAIGRAMRFVGDKWLGSSAWVFDGSETSRIGLVDAEHTRGDGYQENDAYLITETGVVAGAAVRFVGKRTNGMSAWVHDVSIGTTFPVGLSDDRHTAPDGQRQTYVHGVFQDGTILGDSRRYDGLQSNTIWVFDVDTNEYTSLSMDGFDLYMNEFTPDGNVLGAYWDEQASDSQGFIWNRGEGLVRAADLVDGPLENYGWRSFDALLALNSQGQLLGEGRLLDGRSALFLLTPTPEPSTLGMAFAGWSLVLAMARMKRRRVCGGRSRDHEVA